MQPIADYFLAERAESLLFMGVGLVALAVAALALSGRLWSGRPRPWRRGLAAALAAVAAIQLAVGAGIWLRSPQDIERVTRIVQTDMPRIASQEIPRMEVVMRNFVVYRWIEIVLLVLGLGLAWRAARGSGWQGLGLGLAPQAGLMLALDFAAEQRGQVYLDWLRSLT